MHWVNVLANVGAPLKKRHSESDNLYIGDIFVKRRPMLWQLIPDFE